MSRRPFRFAPTREAHNERLKLICNYVNAVGIACFLGGVVAPLIDTARAFDAALAGASVAALAGSFLVSWRLIGYIRDKD
ncbi:MAG: hypothetical protein NW200_01455 [Hyphomonadaceae bacterium]|nr:hypothetical protein [Hyphomonadaceae bacterium]